LDSLDKVHISYYDVTNGDLKHATNASGSWVTETVDSAGDVGQYTSIAIDSSDYVHISYYDATNGDLKYVTTAQPVGNTRPIANPGGPYTGIEGQAITLDGSGSSDPDGTIELYEWDINNDGPYEYSSNLPSQSHTYAQQGTYTIKLRVIDNVGATDEAITTATISDTSPTADFVASPTSGAAPLTVNFTNNSTGYDQPLSYGWDFDNDGIIDSTTENPSYNNAGTYTVSLTVTDSDGSTETLTKTDYITVTPSIYTLTVNVTGDGSGTVTSSPVGIECGADCTEAYEEGTVVTLTAVAEAGSTFTGWAGGGCSGTGDCVLTMNADTTVTATFDICPNPPVKIGATYYSTPQQAYNAADNGDIIQIQGVRFVENLNIYRNISVTLEGGYSCDYTEIIGETRLKGAMTISKGTLTIGNFVVEK
jgi:PKD repeat protein